MRRNILLLLAAIVVLAACGSTDTVEESATAEESDVDAEDSMTTSNGSSSFVIEVWADNWMAVYVNGELIGEDSVSITTERSFNAETFTFEATYPFTLAIEAKDFKETDSGLEYIGTDRQQMGDGGLIAQVTDTTTGSVVSVTDSSWSAFVVHRAPLNVDCEQSADPDTECQFEIIDVPADWATTDFDDSGWASATEWTEDAVSPRDGYDQVDWDPAATLVWGTDLEVDNTVLFRTDVTG